MYYWYRMPNHRKVAIIAGVVAIICGLALIIQWVVYNILGTSWYGFLIIGIVLCIVNIWNLRNVWVQMKKDL